MNNLDPEVAEKPHELVVYGGIAAARRARLGKLRPHRFVAAHARGRRDAVRPIRQAGRDLSHACRRAARADRELQHRAALGDARQIPGARSQGLDDVRPDDGRLVDLHRLTGDRAGHLRDLCGSWAAATMAAIAAWAAGFSRQVASAAWAARSRSPRPSRAQACWQSSASSSRIEMRGCAPAISTGRLRRWTRRSP